MAEIEGALLEKVHALEGTRDPSTLTGFLRPRKKRIGTLIEAKDGQSLKELKREVKKKGGKKLKVYKEINTLYAEMPVEHVSDLASIACAQKVYDAEGDIKLTLNESVPLVMGVEKWQLPYRFKHRKLEGQGVKVAVIDSGIDKKHPDFAWRIKKVKNFSGGRKYKGTEHGTHVAGIIAGSGKVSGYRFVGIAPKVKLYIAKIFVNSEIPTTRQIVIKATLWAIRKKVHIINMSFGDAHGCNDGTCPLCKVANYAVEKGVSVITAAGNAGPSEGTITCPGNAKQTITVGATTKRSPIMVMGWSSRGSASNPGKPDLVAPGDNITAPQPEGQYTNMSGTSMAAPHITGFLALLYQSRKYLRKWKKFTPPGFKKALKYSCIDIGEHPESQGSGLAHFVASLPTPQQRKKEGIVDYPKRKGFVIDFDKLRKESQIPEDFVDEVEKELGNFYSTKEEYTEEFDSKIHWDIPGETLENYKKLIWKYHRKEYLSSIPVPKASIINNSQPTTCPALMKMFCPHYDENHCNTIYEKCIHYQSTIQTKVLQKTKEIY